MVKVVVKGMEVAGVLCDAVRMFCDQFCLPEMPPVGPQRGRGSNRKTRRLTTSRTKESFARDWNDRLLSEYRFGWSEAGFEFGTSAVTTNLGWCGRNSSCSSSFVEEELQTKKLLSFVLATWPICSWG